VKYHHFSLVYGLGFRYEEKALSSETKEAKIMYRIDDFKFLSNNEIRIVVPKKVAEELVKHEKIVISLIEKPKNK
jgi:hypothetical protein